ncbi:MAG: response regulator transcription factor [Actinobacteria bacterium]|nr:response regulator transcription factor [Actinomycetota bacterium]
MADRIRLVVVEDNQGFREALELLLGLQADMEVVASVADGSSAAAVVRKHQPDVVLMDYRLPGLDGVQATRAVREASPDVAVVCLTASANLREVDALFEAGAVACLSKDQELDEIIKAIRDAA